jgi:hypothetical protein
MVKGKRVAERLVRKGVTAAGVRYMIEPYTNIGPHSLCDHSVGWGIIASKFMYHLKCGYYAGIH